MSRPNEIKRNPRNEDLFESGKAYQNSWFGPDSSGSPFAGGRPPGGHQHGAPGGFGFQEGPYPVPYQQPGPASANPLSQLPIKDIKAFVDRMGGIEGIMNTMQKMNGLMKNIQQMAPMLKLLFGSFSGKSQTADFAQSHRTKRRRKRRRRASTAKRVSGKRPSQKRISSNRR